VKLQNAGEEAKEKTLFHVSIAGRGVFVFE
jgi:hypothetical protein